MKPRQPGAQLPQVPSPAAIQPELVELEDEGLPTFTPLFWRGVLLNGE